MSLVVGTIAGAAGVAVGAGIHAWLRGTVPNSWGRRPSHRAFADLLTWAEVLDPGVLVGKDLSVTIGWRFEGLDPDSSGQAELDSVITALNESLHGLHGGWMLNIQSVRRFAGGYAGRGNFPSAVPALLDAERRRAFGGAASYPVTDSYLLATRALPPEAKARMREAFMTRRARGATAAAREGGAFGAFVHDVEHHLAPCERRLRGLLKLERLGARDLVELCNTCLRGVSQPVTVAAPIVDLSGFLAPNVEETGFEVRIASRHVRLVTLRGFAASGSGGRPVVHALSSRFLDSFPFLFRSSVRMVPLDPEDTAAAISGLRLVWNRKRDSFERARLAREGREDGDRDLFDNTHAVGMVGDARDALGHLAQGDTCICNLTWTLVVHGQDVDRVEQNAAALVDAMRQRGGFIADLETIGSFEALLGSLPAHGTADQRLHMVPLRSALAMSPTTSPWLGEEKCPSNMFPAGSPPVMYMRSSGAGAFRFHFHDGGVGHTLVLGHTGAGKSVLLGALAAQALRFEDSQVFFFDRRFSAAPLALASDATHLDLLGRQEAGGEVSLQPLADLDSEQALQSARAWLELAIEVAGESRRPGDARRIDQGLTSVRGFPMEERTMSAFSDLVPTSRLRELFRQFSIGGQYGSLFDGTASPMASSRFVVFELFQLMSRSEGLAQLVASHLFDLIEKRLRANRPSFVFVDEAKFLLSHPILGDWICDWMIELRKLNTCLILATQEPSHITNLKRVDDLIGSSPTRIFLPDQEAMTKGRADLYDAFQLSENGRRLLADDDVMRRARNYLVSQGRRLAVVDLDLSPLELALLAPPTGVSPETHYEECLRRRATDPEHWVEAMLREQGLEEGARELADLVDPMRRGNGAA